MKAGEPFNPYGMFVGVFIPNWLAYRTELSPGAKLVYGRLCQYAGKDGRAYPKLAALATGTGLCERGVQRNLSALVDAGLIKVEKITGPRAPNSYRFLWHSWIEEYNPGEEEWLPSLPDEEEQVEEPEKVVESVIVVEPTRVKAARTKRKAPLTDAPDLEGFVTQADRDWYEKTYPNGHIDLDATAAKFLDWHAAKGNQYVDWHRALQTWVRREMESGWGRGGQMGLPLGVPSPPSRADKDAAMFAEFGVDVIYANK